MADLTKEEKARIAEQKAFLKEIQTPIDVPIVDAGFIHKRRVVDNYVAVTFPNEKVSIFYDDMKIKKEDGTEVAISIADIDSLIATEKGLAEYKKFTDSISKHIYKHYSEQKQSQDRGWQAYSQTVIVGLTAQTDSPVTLDMLTIEVMTTVLEIYAEQLTLADYVSTKSDELKEHYEKLVKIGIRTKWTKLCIDEAKLAKAESREPNYPTLGDN